MSDERRRVGVVGELLAAAVLVLHGHRILGRRVRTPAGEVDLVCRRGTTLVVVEVKRRRSGWGGGAAYALKADQARRVSAAGRLLARRAGWARELQIVLAAVDGRRVRLIPLGSAPLPSRATRHSPGGL